MDGTIGSGLHRMNSWGFERVRSLGCVWRLGVVWQGGYKGALPHRRVVGICIAWVFDRVPGNE